MYNLLSKYGQVGAFGVGLLITVIFVFSIFSGLDDFNAYAPKDEARFETTIFNFGIAVSMGLTAIAFIFMLFFILVNTGSALANGGFKGMIGILLALIVFGISYAIAEPLTDGPLSEYTQKFNVTEGQSKLISGSVNASVVLLGITVVVFILSELRNIFK